MTPRPRLLSLSLRATLVLASLCALRATPLAAQLIQIKTLPIADGDQWRFFRRRTRGRRRLDRAEGLAQRSVRESGKGRAAERARRRPVLRFPDVLLDLEQRRRRHEHCRSAPSSGAGSRSADLPSRCRRSTRRGRHRVLSADRRRLSVGRHAAAGAGHPIASESVRVRHARPPVRVARNLGRRQRAVVWPQRRRRRRSVVRRQPKHRAARRFARPPPRSAQGMERRRRRSRRWCCTIDSP